MSGTYGRPAAARVVPAGRPGRRGRGRGWWSRGATPASRTARPSRSWCVRQRRTTASTGRRPPGRPSTRRAPRPTRPLIGEAPLWEGDDDVPRTAIDRPRHRPSARHRWRGRGVLRGSAEPGSTPTRFVEQWSWSSADDIGSALGGNSRDLETGGVRISSRGELSLAVRRPQSMGRPVRGLPGHQARTRRCTAVRRRVRGPARVLPRATGTRLRAAAVRCGRRRRDQL